LLKRSGALSRKGKRHRDNRFYTVGDGTLGSLANRSGLSYSRVAGEKEQPMRLARIFSTTLAGFAAAVAVVPLPVTAQTYDKVSIGTNWVAEAEHGGFYQALADGTYRKYGLDVNIVQGGPNTNNRILLPVGKLDFYLSANSLQGFDAVTQNIPTVEVAALFQKDPQVLIAHPDVQKFTDLKNLTLFVSKEGMATYFQWLKADYGFSESRVKPYTFNPQPFLADKKSAMQGYVTSEPFAIEKAAHFKPKVFLLADQGFSAYSTLIETRRDLVDKNPGLVQRFVDATIIGWYNYIFSRNALGNELIKNQNREMTDDLLAYSVSTMKQYGIVDSGDSLNFGIGAMTDERMKSFFDEMVRAGVVKPDLDYRRAYTLQFVNKKVGLNLRLK
jgi:NitT/TauT family transport system substrate-binding protein